MYLNYTRENIIADLKKWGATKQIVTSVVFVDEEKWHINYGYVILTFENGFQWCYWEDVENGQK